MNAEEIIRLQQRLEDDDALFRQRWQDTAKYIFPRESDITEISYPGEAKTDELYDVTAIFASEDMTSGLLTNLIPAGQKFFSLGTSNTEIQEIDIVKSYMAKATEILHEELFSSNFILQLAETLHSLTVFGTGNIFSEWDKGLNFMDWDVSRYQILENFKGQVDTIFLKFQKTAIQAYEKWGKKAGKSVLEIMEPPGGSVDDKKVNDRLWFIHVIRPRKNWNPRFEDDLNMPWESGYIAVKDKTMIEESGFPEFPHHIPRWTKTTGETHGRGIGTMILPQVKRLNAIERDLSECSNKHVNPAMDVLDSFDGTYNVYPGARNDVTEFPTSQAVGSGRVNGNFPIGEETITSKRQIVKDVFYGDAFAPITSTGTGDRRNELEIQQRIAEAFRKIGSPIGRLESELFTPLITRCFMLLVRNHIEGVSRGTIPPPPQELQGQNLKIMYKGPLSLAQQDAEVRASMRWAGAVAELESASPAFAGASDNINVDKTTRRWARVMGVNEDDIATEEERDAKRQQRQVEAQEKRALEAAQVAAGAYGQTTKAPEEGSAAEQMGVV